MNHYSLNNSSLFSICLCCGSSIYGLTVTTDSTVIPRAAIGLNIHVFTTDRNFWRFGVYLACFLGGLSVYWWGFRRNISAGTWCRLSNRIV